MTSRISKAPAARFNSTVKSPVPPEPAFITKLPLESAKIDELDICTAVAPTMSVTPVLDMSISGEVTETFVPPVMATSPNESNEVRTLVATSIAGLPVAPGAKVTEPPVPDRISTLPPPPPFAAAILIFPPGDVCDPATMLIAPEGPELDAPVTMETDPDPELAPVASSKFPLVAVPAPVVSEILPLPEPPPPDDTVTSPLLPVPDPTPVSNARLPEDADDSVAMIMLPLDNPAPVLMLMDPPTPPLDEPACNPMAPPLPPLCPTPS